LALSELMVRDDDHFNARLVMADGKIEGRTRGETCREIFVHHVANQFLQRL